MSTEHPAGEEDPCVDDMMSQVIDLETQKRLWVRALIPLVQLRRVDPDDNERVQLSNDLLHIAACDRIRRILGSDVNGDD